MPDFIPAPALKLGKAPAQSGGREFLLRPLLKARGTLPNAYDFDTRHPGIPTPMFGNDQYRNCVIAAQAHQTLRFELLQQKRLLDVTTEDVNQEYFRQTGGAAYDDGLSVRSALEQWRTVGWQVEGNTYTIAAYTRLNYLDFQEVRQVIYADVGLGLGLQLPLSAQQQLDDQQPWRVVTGPEAVEGSWGGHYVYVCGYTPDGPICVTWGRKQRLSWDWLAKYADEAYAIFDADNHFKSHFISTRRLQEVIRSFS